MSAFPVQQFRDTLIEWFCREGKSYPWRKTHDPWHILVSEVMLQQTTIPTVLARYTDWLTQFPTPASLANATDEQALRSWEGLGYYRRVRSLKAIAEVITCRHNGIFPTDRNQLLQLPGIGEYTAGAVLSFAFNIPAPIVDANVSRVIARLDNYRNCVDSTVGKKYMWQRAAELVDPADPRRFNSALMELGQTYCKSGVPACLCCPIRQFCQAESPEVLPLKTPKAPITRLERHDILCLQQGEGLNVLMAKQGENSHHQGMYRFPERTKDETAPFPVVYKQHYSITRFKVARTLHLVSADDIQPRPDEEFFPVASLESLPLPSPDRKAWYAIATMDFSTLIQSKS